MSAHADRPKCCHHTCDADATHEAVWAGDWHLYCAKHVAAIRNIARAMGAPMNDRPLDVDAKDSGSIAEGGAA